MVQAMVLAACGDDNPSSGRLPDGGEMPRPPDGDGDGTPADGDDEPGDGDADGMSGDGMSADGMSADGISGDGMSADGDAGTGGDGGGDGDGGAGEPQAAWYACQSSDQAFVRKAVTAVLGRRPYSQAEVDVYTDLIGQIDALDGVFSETNAPGSKMRRSRRILLDVLFKDPQYKAFWTDVFRDIIRVQRVDEMAMVPCFGSSLNADPVGVASYIRSNPATASGGDVGAFTMQDVIAGSLSLDDVTPIYAANLFAMLSETYAGANAEPVALEISRRQDFGAWFDAVYLNRDVVCLGCHNSEFSVTQSFDPDKNRHFPVPGLLEKSLFGASTGPSTYGGYEGVDRMHAPLRYNGFVNTCTRTMTQEDAEITCPSPTELVWRCSTGNLCESEYQRRLARPWGWDASCGRYTEPDALKVDVAMVEAKFGNLTGLRTSAWDLSESLRAGFVKLRNEGLGVSAEGEVSDPDKAFAYLVAMNVAEKVWLQLVGTPLTIPTRFPRNAAARDELHHLTETFIRSGFSNQRLIQAVLASPYANVAPPEEGCGELFSMPNVFDPWVIAEDDPTRRKNNPGDGIASLPARTAASIVYSALGWNHSIPFPIVPRSNDDPTRPLLQAERWFQTETGFFLKNAESGFRGFDFQARLGWENRFATCEKLPSVNGDDFIDKLASSVTKSGQATVADLVEALKDRLLGESEIEETVEKEALEIMLGASLTADATTLTDAAAGLRKVCGVIVSSPQFVLTGLPPKDGVSVPKLTPASASYGAVCAKLEASLSGEVNISCPRSGSLTVVTR